MDIFTPILWLLNSVTGGWINRRRVRVRVHAAYFRNGNPTPYYFVNVTNRSRSRDVEITHVWFATDPEVRVLNPGRPLLHVRLQYDQPWETWIAADAVPANEHDAKLLARVRLSSGETVHSRPNDDVPAEGFIPGSTYVGSIGTSEPISLSGRYPPD